MRGGFGEFARRGFFAEKSGEGRDDGYTEAARGAETGAAVEISQRDNLDVFFDSGFD